MNKTTAVSAVVAVLVVGLVVVMAVVVRQWSSKPLHPDSVFNLSAATGNIEPVGEPMAPNPTLLKHGEWVYRGLCIGCHGIEGDGNGAVWELADVYAPEHKLPRKPRDFTEAVFKLRSTPSGSFPTDVDLFKSISRGLVAEHDMPAFKFLPERDRWAVIAYIKTLSQRWEEEEEWQEDPITIAEPPLPDPATLLAGKDVYARMQCAECHGPVGKGDGPSAPGLEDDSGLPIVPRDFTDAAQFVGDSSPKGVYQTFTTGLDGTPMPSFADFLDEDQRWQLVWYVTSLRPDFDLYAARVNLLEARGEDIALAALTPVAAPTPAQAAAPASAAAQEGTVVVAATTETTSDQVSAGDSGAAAASEETAADEPAKPVFLGKYQETGVTGGGTIQGKVVYNGSIKKKTVLPTKDKRVCGKVRKEPLILVGDGGAVEDSVVYLKGIESGKPVARDADESSRARPGRLQVPAARPGRAPGQPRYRQFRSRASTTRTATTASARPSTWRSRRRTRRSPRFSSSPARSGWTATRTAGCWAGSTWWTTRTSSRPGRTARSRSPTCRRVNTRWRCGRSGWARPNSRSPSRRAGPPSSTLT